MSDEGKYKNNPLYKDITKLDHLSPQPTFSYSWNTQSGVWEPSTVGANSSTLDLSFLEETLNRNNRNILSGISGISINNDSSTNVSISRADSQPWKLVSKTVNQKIEEDFLLMENIPDEQRFGEYSGITYGSDRFIIDDLFNTYYPNARSNPSTPETGHPQYFIHEESIDTGRGSELYQTFHSDTQFSLRQECSGVSPINSYELKDFSRLYEQGLLDSVLLFNETTYPIQFHTIDEYFDESKLNDEENTNIMYLYSDASVRISSDEAKKIFIKLPHCISGYTAKYTLTYKSTGYSDII